MTFVHPNEADTHQLLALWKSVFGDWNGFWEGFLETGFSPDRCRCIAEQGQIIAALTWLDGSCNGQKIAYVYAVVTSPDHRGRGLCRALMADTHALLRSQGYAASLLVPAEHGLRAMYEKLGYEECTFVEEFKQTAGEEAVSITAIGPEEFARLRRKYLPEGGVVQEEESLAFLARQAQFYAGTDFLMAAYADEKTLTAMELLGNKQAASGILRALGCKEGSFRCPGDTVPFAMWYPLQTAAKKPAYFGFAFD